METNMRCWHVHLNDVLHCCLPWQPVGSSIQSTCWHNLQTSWCWALLFHLDFLFSFLELQHNNNMQHILPATTAHYIIRWAPFFSPINARNLLEGCVNQLYSINLLEFRTGSTTLHTKRTTTTAHSNFTIQALVHTCFYFTQRKTLQPRKKNLLPKIFIRKWSKTLRFFLCFSMRTWRRRVKPQCTHNNNITSHPQRISGEFHTSKSWFA